MKRSIVISAAAVALAAAAACGGSAKTPAARPAPAPSTDAAPAGGRAKAVDLSTAEGVLEASLAAQGGRERMGKVKAMRQLGTFRIPQMGMKGAMTSLSSAPRNSMLLIELPGIGNIRQGVSGDVAWEVSPLTGARVITGDERAQLLRESTFNGELIWKQLYPKAELAGEVEFAGKPAVKVVLTAADGDVQTRYLAKDTLLPLGVQTVARTQMGQVPVEVEVSDWREVGGIKYPHRMQRKEGPQTIEVVIDKIELDPKLDPDAFAVPPEIQALAKPVK